ncbi:hypothetical protein HMSSN036_33650 [Paenibacillus macerans]|nr:hypothetical protein HMSSN036_33650 [Paenibacillus macerans]
MAMNTLLKQWIPGEERRAEVRRTAERLSLDIAEYLEQTFGPCASWPSIWPSTSKGISMSSR